MKGHKGDNAKKLYGTKVKCSASAKSLNRTKITGAASKTGPRRNWERIERRIHRPGEGGTIKQHHECVPFREDYITKKNKKKKGER